MKTIPILLMIVFIINCNSLIELRSSKHQFPHDVKAGCYRQVGMLKAVYKDVATTEVKPSFAETEMVPASKDTKKEKIVEQEGYNSCSYNGDILFCKEVPTKYKEVTVYIEHPAYTKTIQTPEIQVSTIRPTVVEPEKPDIRSVLCPEYATSSLIRKMQESLKNAGFDPGDMDGKLYKSTMNAIKEYEIRKGFKVEERSGDDFIMQNTVNILTK